MRDRSIALVVRDDKILSVQTYRSGRYINELPGGGIENGESPEEAAIRELKEECGSGNKPQPRCGLAQERSACLLLT